MSENVGGIIMLIIMAIMIVGQKSFRDGGGWRG